MIHKSLLIENESYLYACGQYVEYNPVKAGIVERAEDWGYSSARYYLKKKENLLIDNYEKPQGSVKIPYTDVIGFEKGDGIGSDYFKFRLRRGLR